MKLIIKAINHHVVKLKKNCTFNYEWFHRKEVIDVVVHVVLAMWEPPWMFEFSTMVPQILISFSSC